MSSRNNKSKRQSLCMIGIGLICLSFLILSFALSLPKVSYIDYASKTEASDSVAVTTESTRSIETPQATDFLEESVDTTLSSDAIIIDKTTNCEDTIDVHYPLNINTCTMEELVTIKGIGESRASAIIQYREYLGGYTSVEQIKNIKGIGDSLYEKVVSYLTV